MNLSLSNIVVRLIVAVLVYFFGDIVINTFVADPNANKMFHIVLLILCLLIVLFGSLLPF